MADDRVAVDAAAVGAAAWIAAVGVLTALAWHYLPFVTDDALISLRYAARLLEGGGLTFTAGDRVEGYSNLLWVLLVAAGGGLTRDLVLVARVLGWMSTVATLGAVAWAGARAGAGRAGLFAALAALALAHGLAIWTIGGLEQALLAALLAWTLALVATPPPRAAAPHGAAPRDTPALPTLPLTRPWVISLLLALLALTRVDGALFTALVILALLLSHDRSPALLRDARRLVTLPAIAACGQLAFRLAYYGDWLPNTARVKLATSPTHTLEGLRYVGHALASHAPMVLLVVAGLLTLPPRSWRRRNVLVPLTVAVGWLAYVIVIGGDIFPGTRHFIPVLVALAFLVLAAWRDGLPGRLSTAAQLALLAFICASYGWLQQRDPDNVAAAQERQEWDCARVMATLRAGLGDRDPLVAGETIGCIGYFGRFRTLDMLGLTDRHIARTRPADFGRGILGHELGDGRYVLSRKPDVLMFCGSLRTPPGCYRSARELARLPAFARDYVRTMVAAGASGAPWPVWVRAADGPAGVRREGRDRITIPGWLFTSEQAGAGATAAAVSADARAADATGADVPRLVARIPPRGVVTFDRLAAELRAAAAASSPSGTKTAAAWSARATASRPVVVTVDASGVRVAAGADGSDLVEVLLTR